MEYLQEQYMKSNQLLAALFVILLMTGCKKNGIDQTTNPPVPVYGTIVTTIPANISADSAVTGGVISIGADKAVTESGVCYAINTSPTVGDNKVIQTVADGRFTVSLKHLLPVTTYYIRAYFINTRGVTYGNEYSFKTISNPPVDSTSFVQKLEEYYHSGNPNYTNKNRDYTFYYDNSKRVVKVGLKNYSPIGFDTATTLLYYQGAAVKPYMVVVPNTETISPVLYDTIYFAYNANNQIIADSSNELYNPVTGERVFSKRIYSYPDPSKSYINNFKQFFPGSPVELFRADTINNSSPSIVTQLYSPGNVRGNYAKTEAFTFSNYINPLSRLNIAGTIFSLIYKPVGWEILGNSWHKAVFNSNGLPYYLDFYSSKIPSLFYLGGFTPGGFLISAQYDVFTITVVPLPGRLNYPSVITVQMSTSYPDDSFIYKYYY